MHYVSKISAAAALTPKIYDKVSTGFRRATYVDHAMGSVHMGVGICHLAPNGFIEPHLHSFEESLCSGRDNPGADRRQEPRDWSRPLRVDQYGRTPRLVQCKQWDRSVAGDAGSPTSCA